MTCITLKSSSPLEISIKECMSHLTHVSAAETQNKTDYSFQVPEKVRNVIVAQTC